MAFSRRGVLAGMAAGGGLMLGGCAQEPPTYGNVLRMGDWFTYNAQRMMIPRRALAREYGRGDITSTVAVGTVNPGNDHEAAFNPTAGPLWAQLAAREFAGWALEVVGAVARPGRYSLDTLLRFPARTQITRHTCEEGWSAISEWTGVPLRLVLEHAGIMPGARFVKFETYDLAQDSIDMFDALHPQTILAYGMNGTRLPHGHGAPLRVRVETQLGYKSVKFLRRIVVTEQFDDGGKFGNIAGGYAWFAGI